MNARWRTWRSIRSEVREVDQSDGAARIHTRFAAMVAEGGTIFVLDRNNGQFLWATPFPYDDPNFILVRH